MKIGKITISLNKSLPDHRDISYSDVKQKYDAGLKSGKKLILGTLSGRSGTRWLCDIFSEHDNATGITERDATPESFYRYIKYNNLAIDTAGIITLIKKGIIDDWQKSDIALVFSPYFSHGISELEQELKPDKIIFAISEPEFSIQSMYNKGLFKEDYIRSSSNYSLGFQPELGRDWSHFFGRIVPNKEQYQKWLNLTRLGKIAWFSNRLVVDIYNQLKTLPEDKLFIFNLQQASENYDYYKNMAQKFGLQPLLSEKRFFEIQGKWFKGSHNVKHKWTEKERQEFEEQANESLEIFQELSK